MGRVNLGTLTTEQTIDLLEEGFDNLTDIEQRNLIFKWIKNFPDVDREEFFANLPDEFPAEFAEYGN